MAARNERSGAGGRGADAPRAWRPYMLRIHTSSNIVVSNLSFVDPGFWCIVPTYSQGVEVADTSVVASHSSPNTDGLRDFHNKNSLSVLLERINKIKKK